MKKYKICFNDQADFDLQQIFDYIYNVLENPIAARKVINGILKKCADLTTLPKLRPIKITSNGFDFRMVHCGHYTLVFVVDEEEGEVIVYRVIYSRRDIASLLK